MRNQKGITLIALVITIIVLLILAGVSIAMLTGQNGILTRATDATNATVQGDVEEATKLAVAGIIADNEGFPSEGITTTNLTDTVLQKMNSGYNYDVTRDGDYLKVVGTSGNKTGTVYVKQDSGAVTDTKSGS